jgi:ferrous iron transport protein B
MILSGDESLKEWLMTNINTGYIKTIEDLRDEAQSKLKEPISSLIGQTRIKLAEDITKKVQKNSAAQSGILVQSLSKWTMHTAWGAFILLLVMAGFYGFVGKFGAGILVDFMQDVIFGRYLNPATEKIVRTVIPVAFIQDMFVGQYGIFSMALMYALGIILPITTTFFLAFGFLEDSGYLPRLAVVSDKVFRFLGLNGKAVLPMILGLGCGTMATMSTRILETGRERVIAIFLIALAIPCSAQLGVVFDMLGMFSLRAALWWAGCIIMVLIFTGYLASQNSSPEKNLTFS